MLPPGTDDRIRTILHNFGFDEELFSRLRQRLRGPHSSDPETIRSPLTPPEANEIHGLPEEGTPEFDALYARGKAAIQGGQVGSIILAGGMATRFGGMVKAGVEVYQGQTFLDLKLRDAQRTAEDADGHIPVFIMTSFATDGGVRELLERHQSDRAPAYPFGQFVSLRVDRDGEIFLGEDGQPSPCAMGHGDLPFALRRSGLLQTFREQGGELLCMSNVDNLTASLNPALIGWHLQHDHGITVEVTDKHPGDKGGAPAKVDGVLQIVEGFRFPDDFDQDQIPVFNTNSLTFDAAALELEQSLDFFTVRKKVAGQDVYQFERLVGQLTAFISSAYLRVPREGRPGRFHPVKDPDELQRRLPDIVAALKARRVL